MPDSTFIITETVVSDAASPLYIIINEGQLWSKKNLDGTILSIWRGDDLELPAPVGLEDQLLVGELDGERVSLLDSKVLNNLPESGAWYGLRDAIAFLDDTYVRIFSRAIQLEHWRNTHRYCGVCGSATLISSEDRAYVCTNCGHRMYPRVSPCVIGTVRRGKEIVLAQGVRHPGNIYSAIAGFIEPGETAEQAFEREVFEEIGIYVNNVRYLCSQSWPFPGQLMLGFVADYASGELSLDETEIVDAKWCDSNDLPELPPTFTISRKIIDIALKMVE